MKFMTATLLALGLAAPASATESPEGVVNRLFDAMRAGDGATILSLAVPDAGLDRLKTDGTLHRGTFDGWAKWVDTLKPGQADEQIFGVKTFREEGDEFATVWAPFVVSLDGEVKGCGVNQFTRAKTAEGWRILYGIDKPTTEDCTAFRAGFQ